MKKIKLSLFAPRYWPAWLGLGLLWSTTLLPYRFRIALGVWLGKLLYLFPSQLKHITQVNLQLCFPEMTQEQQRELAKKNFSSLGTGLMESAMAWWLPDKKLQLLYQIDGLEHVEKAFAQGNGIILIAPHFICLEIVGRLIGMKYTFGVMYRPHKKPFISFIHERFRKKHYVNYIPSNKVRQLLKALQQNTAIWYAYDIDAGTKRSVFAPFFGIPTASLTTVSRLAKLSEAAVIPIAYYRCDDTSGYRISLSAPLENFPSDDPVLDATRLNATLEQAIRQNPEQYVWQYKRFKTRPGEEKRFY